ncbi:MAG: AMP-binding protein [Bdellovibrionaceae bacterium]|nr:AMP-binding protein [Pseudobdellovibrionaceae bacterium]
MLYHWTKEIPDAVYLRQPINGQYTDYTWKEVNRQVRLFAGYLKSLDLPPGSNVGIFSKNCAHWMMADLAIMMAGHVSVPLYPNLTADSIAQIMEHSATKVLFIGKLDNFSSMAPGIPADTLTIGFPYPGADFKVSWNDVLNSATPITDSPTRHESELATIIYTSGTSGTPKGVMQTFKSMAAVGSNGCMIANIEPADRFFSYLPLAHCAERALVELCSLYGGGVVYFAESLDTFAENLRTARPSLFLGVPRIWTKFQGGILNKLPQKKLDLFLRIPILSSIIRKKIVGGLGLDQAKMTITGAAPTPASLIDWFARLGINLQEAYGMTENFAYSHLNPADNIKVGTVGIANPEVDVKLSEESEILVKSPCTMTGYYKAPEMTAEMFAGEYLRTGDKGSIDSDGFLKITGRVKDLFKTSKGKYVAPAPIELKIAKSDLVEQVCVVGAGLPQPLAIVVLSEMAKGSEGDQLMSHFSELLEEINAQLDSHERLRKFVVVGDEWTVENSFLTPSMKLKRAMVEDAYGTNYEPWFNQSGRVIRH